MLRAPSYPREKIKILFLEGVHPIAAEPFENAGYHVECRAEALQEDQLVEIMPTVHLLGIRSKTQISARALQQARRLIGIGCYCIGTDQVDLAAAARQGVPVFNAPFSNTRSVAELAIAEVVMLARKAAQRSQELHGGQWRKSAAGCFEVRHKTMGIVGYGHIGPQVGLLAEALGMEVIFYDIVPRLPLGTAMALPSLEAVLKAADFVTMHVPDTPKTGAMIGKEQLALMKPGSYLLNLSRGSVVDLEALAAALQRGHLAGAAVDVFPQEPASNNEPFASPLQGLANTILTPHIGGSTQEAQLNIGLEVSRALLKLIETGSSSGAVNFPNIELPLVDSSHRVLNIHQNVPGILSQINGLIAETGANINAQFLGTDQAIGYLIMDVGPELSRTIKKKIDALPPSIKTRLLF